MYPLIAEWESSSEGQLQFCQSRGISLSVFSYWRKKYLEDQQGSRAGFTEILPGFDSQVEVCYPNGVRVNLPFSDNMLETLHALIRLV